mgnify:FL=1
MRDWELVSDSALTKVMQVPFVLVRNTSNLLLLMGFISQCSEEQLK